MSILPEPNPQALLDTPELLRRRRRAALVVAALGADDVPVLLEMLGLKSYVGLDRPDRTAGGRTGLRQVLRDGLGVPSSWPPGWRDTA